jgi:hypothetical protein
LLKRGGWCCPADPISRRERAYLRRRRLLRVGDHRATSVSHSLGPRETSPGLATYSRTSDTATMVSSRSVHRFGGANSHRTGQTQVCKQARGQEEGTKTMISRTRMRLTSQQRELLSTTFQCLFCNHENSVSVKIDKKASTGELTCKVCGQTFQTVTNCTFPRKKQKICYMQGL